MNLQIVIISVEWNWGAWKKFYLLIHFFIGDIMGILFNFFFSI